MDKKMVHNVAFLLTVVGALNWGLVALFDLNLVSMLLSAWPEVEKGAYVLVGVSAVYIAATHAQYCSWCSGKK